VKTIFWNSYFNQDGLVGLTSLYLPFLAYCTGILCH